ncbi:MAG: hypothetical protein ACE10D_04435, partial [Planctomycetota bacterium]
FTNWLAGSKNSIGVDLLEDVELLMELMDEARVKADWGLTKKVRPGSVYYVRRPLERRKETFDFTVRVPRQYKPKSRRYPLVISMHRAVLNRRHRAFRDAGEFRQRGRQPITEYWADRNQPARDKVIVIAPTGLPVGYQFKGRALQDVWDVWLSVREGMRLYRVDWDRIFVELEGIAMRFACQQPFGVTGYIVRDGELAAEDMFLLENLNGVPLLYVANEARGDVSKRMIEGLKAAYAKTEPKNLIILHGKRDNQGGLKGDMAQIAEFVTTRRRMPWPKKITWRFPDGLTVEPFLFAVLKAETEHDGELPLEQMVGRMTLEFKSDTYEEDGEKRPYTRVEVNITEAEQLRLRLHDGIAVMSDPITIVVNGVEVASRVMIKRDFRYFVENVLPGRFFMIPFMGETLVDFKFTPQWKRPERKKVSSDQ